MIKELFKKFFKKNTESSTNTTDNRVSLESRIAVYKIIYGKDGDSHGNHKRDYPERDE